MAFGGEIDDETLRELMNAIGLTECDRLRRSATRMRGGSGLVARVARLPRGALGRREERFRQTLTR
jgi:hypothetical protein